MTSPSGAQVDGHIDIDELADAAEGLVAPDRASAIEAHLAECSQCTENAAALAEVQDLLGSAPAETMPDEVFARLQGVLDDQQHRRQTEARQAASHHQSQHGSSPYATDSGRPTVYGGGRFPKPHIAEHFTDTFDDPRDRRRGLRAKVAGGAVAGALLASTVGFGGYVLSASAGTYEPPADQPIVVQSEGLAPAATAEVQQGDLDAYRFSQAWRCAKKVTDGPIDGIRSVVVDGESGYLVFLRGKGGVTKAVVVTGCDTGTPQARSTTEVREN